MKEQIIDIHSELIAKCKKGNKLAQYKLYQLYARAMYNVCLRMVNQEEDAKDLLQDGFIKVFQHIKTFRNESTFGAWIKRIMINTCLGHLRRNRPDFNQLEKDMEEIIPDQQPQADSENLKLEVEKVKKAIKKLPDGYRLVFNLYLLEGYDHEEISQILGISTSTSKTQYLRAKRKIKDILSKEVNYGREF